MGLSATRIARVVVLVSIAITPVVATAQGGYVHGADHCYSFEVPPGWLADNRAGVDQGAPIVFYPIGSTWESAHVVMYTRPVTHPDQGAAAIDAQIAEVIAMYRARSQSVVADRIGDVEAADGVMGHLWSFSGHSNGGTELAVYFVGQQTVNFFVAQIPRGASTENAQRALVELASSYREAADCKPCDSEPSCDDAE